MACWILTPSHTVRIQTWIVLLPILLGCPAAPTANRPLPPAAPPSHDQILAEAFDDQVHNLQVEGSGVVIRLLSDDKEGSRHQRFIVELDSGQELLIAHNIDLAPRINGLRKGDRIAFYGEYEWNERGGVIHWTHRDPDERHETGWIRHNGRTYQ